MPAGREWPEESNQGAVMRILVVAMGGSRDQASSLLTGDALVYCQEKGSEEKVANGGKCSLTCR